MPTPYPTCLVVRRTTKSRLTRLRSTSVETGGFPGVPMLSNICLSR